MIAVISTLGWQIYHAQATAHAQTTAVAKQKASAKKASSKKASQKVAARKKAQAQKVAAKKKAAKDLWKKPTGGTYPKLDTTHKFKLTVSLKKQRVYLEDETTNKRLYTMICSSGIDNTTPTGTYAIQERGESFYNNQLSEGANYWVSWLYHGVYLFHSVPTDQSGQYKVSEAQKLGKPASHGCIRLSVPDAKWLYDNIPYGSTVVVG